MAIINTNTPVRTITRIGENARPQPRLSPYVGGGMAIPAGYFIRGKYGEDILMGGLASVQGEMGEPNTFKTTIALFTMLEALNTMAYSYGISELMIYCSEGTLTIERINMLCDRYDYLERDELGNIIVDFSSVTKETPEEWFDGTFANYIKKKKESKDYLVEIEFLREFGTDKPLKVLLPTGVLLDTITFFNPSTSSDSVMGNVKGKGGVMDKSKNTLGLNDAKFKYNVISGMVPSLLRTNTYGIITAHVGKNVVLDDGMYSAKEIQQIGSLTSKEKIQGVPNNYTKITTSLWQMKNGKPLFDDTSKLAKYPKGGDLDKVKEELFTVNLKQHRCKDNMSRVNLTLIISQVEGVLPHLSQFHMLREAKEGFIGNNLSYSLILLPEVNLSRTKVRNTIDTNPKLRRALELTSDYFQMVDYFPLYGQLGLYCGLETLYKDIDNMGYCWDKILTLTRNFWTPMHYSKLGYLNILNLLKIRVGSYDNKDLLKLISKDVKDKK